MAVFTEPDIEEIQGQLCEYKIPQLTSIIGLSEGIENTTYVLYSGDDKHILTMFERRVEVRDIAFFDEFMTTLKDQGIRCPQLVKTREGRLHFFNSDRLCVIQTPISGLVYIHPTPGNCFDAGVVLGKMHRVAASIRLGRDNPVGVRTWNGLYQRIDAHLSEEWVPRQNLLEDIVNEVTKNWPEHLTSGPIHADYFKENVLFKPNSRVGVIDFFLGCTDLYAYDLALALTSWGFDQTGKFEAANFKAFLKGYDTERVLSLEEREALPLLIQAGTLRILLTRLTDEWQRRHPNVATIRQSKEYWKKLVSVQKMRESDGFSASLV